MDGTRDDLPPLPGCMQYYLLSWGIGLALLGAVILGQFARVPAAGLSMCGLTIGLVVVMARGIVEQRQWARAIVFLVSAMTALNAAAILGIYFSAGGRVADLATVIGIAALLFYGSAAYWFLRHGEYFRN